MSLSRQFNTRPLYQQVADEFVARIVTRQWPPGQPIENEADIARSLGISLGTVRKAFDILTNYRVLERQQGRGTVVVDLESNHKQSWFSNIFKNRKERVCGDLAIQDVDLVFPDEAIADAMEVNIRTPLVRFERHGSYEGRVFMVEDVYLRADASAQGASKEQLWAMAEARWGGRDLATRKSETVRPAAAEERDATMFGVAVGTPILVLERVIFSYQARPLELRFARCHLDKGLCYTAY